MADRSIDASIAMADASLTVPRIKAGNGNSRLEHISVSAFYGRMFLIFECVEDELVSVYI